MIVCQLLTVRSQVPQLVSPQQQGPGQEQYLHGRGVYPNRWINLKWLAESDSYTSSCDMQGSPSAALVNVEEQMDLLPPSLISGVVSSSILNLSSLNCKKIEQLELITCSHARDDASLSRAWPADPQCCIFIMCARSATTGLAVSRGVWISVWIIKAHVIVVLRTRQEGPTFCWSKMEDCLAAYWDEFCIQEDCSQLIVHVPWYCACAIVQCK